MSTSSNNLPTEAQQALEAFFDTFPDCFNREPTASERDQAYLIAVNACLGINSKNVRMLVACCLEEAFPSDHLSNSEGSWRHRSTINS